MKGRAGLRTCLIPRMTAGRRPGHPGNPWSRYAFRRLAAVGAQGRNPGQRIPGSRPTCINASIPVRSSYRSYGLVYGSATVPDGVPADCGTRRGVNGEAQRPPPAMSGGRRAPAGRGGAARARAGRRQQRGGGRGVPCPPALENTWRPTGFPRCGPRQSGAIVGDRHAPARSGACVALRRAVADETDLRLYPVEHDLRGLSAAQLADARRAPGEAVRRAIRRGSHIRYVPRIWAPVERRCLGLFASAGPTLVRHVNGRRAVPAGPRGRRAQPGARRKQPNS
jgi:hypothetical protein